VGNPIAEAIKRLRHDFVVDYRMRKERGGGNFLHRACLLDVDRATRAVNGIDLAKDIAINDA